MKTPKNVVEITQRIEMVLSKNRSSLSTNDVKLLERCIFFFKKMRKVKSEEAKKELLAQGISSWIEFLVKNELLVKYSVLLESLKKDTN